MDELSEFRKTPGTEQRRRLRRLIPVGVLAALAAPASVAVWPRRANIVRQAVPVASGPLRAGDAKIVRVREALPAAEPSDAVLRPVAPVGSVVFNEKPAFLWTAPDNARDFVVEVYDSNSEKVVTSDKVQERIWYSTKALARGKVFSWTITATIGGVRVTAPRAPEPKATFRVLAESETSQLQAARNVQPVSELRVAGPARRGLLLLTQVSPAWLLRKIRRVRERSGECGLPNGDVSSASMAVTFGGPEDTQHSASSISM